MERLTERIAKAESALARLQEVASIETPEAIERDAAIPRFAFTFEMVWKAARAVLMVRLGPERPNSGSPKAIIRESRIAGWLDDDQTESALAMADDRNAVVHVYNEELAAALHRRLSHHAELLANWLAAVNTAAQA